MTAPANANAELLQKAQSLMGQGVSAEMLDMLIIQLRGAMKIAVDAPTDVRESGEKFIEALDRWSESKKAETR